MCSVVQCQGSCVAGRSGEDPERHQLTSAWTEYWRTNSRRGEVHLPNVTDADTKRRSALIARWENESSCSTGVVKRWDSQNKSGVKYSDQTGWFCPLFLKRKAKLLIDNRVDRNVTGSYSWTDMERYRSITDISVWNPPFFTEHFSQ